MAVSLDNNMDHVRVLSDLSGLVVGALLDEEGQARGESDPFAEALRRYRKEGQPLDLEDTWRHAIEPAPVRAGDTAAAVLRLLARDLLACVRSPDSAVDASEAETEEPPPNVHPIAGGPASAVPALEFGSDGTWRPSASAAVSAVAPEVAHRHAHVSSMGSRYPVAPPPRAHAVLPPPPPSAAVPSRPTRNVPAAPPSDRAVPPPAPEPMPPSSAGSADPPPRVSAPPAPRADGSERDSVIQAVSGGTEIVAGPFARFQQLAAFVKALRELEGVQSVATRQFVRGTVHLRVRHGPSMDLEQGVLTLTAFSPSLVSSAAGRIELRVEPPDDVPPARG